MNQKILRPSSLWLAWVLVAIPLAAQTGGSVRLDTTLLDYNGSGAKHWTVVWVTTAGGQFIKTLRKQGPSSFTASHWNSHCSAWVTARGGLSSNTAFDGYTSATANDYAGTNSPLVIIWDCRDASGLLVADGNYQFFVQYAEDSGQGPYTTNGLQWTKGPLSSTNTYANQGANFSTMRVTWAAAAPPPQPPAITSQPLPAAATVGVPYAFACQASGSATVGFYAMNLPPGLHLNTAGVLTGIPTQAGTFNGTVIATNGVPPNATQPFSITVATVPAQMVPARLQGGALVLHSSGPPQGQCRLLAASQLTADPAGWTVLQTNAFDATGQLILTNVVDPARPSQFFRLQIP